MEQLNMLSVDAYRAAANEFETPFYIYSRETIEKACQDVMAFPNEYGLTVRYALKSNPLTAFLKIAEANGLHFDASSEYEAYRCLQVGIPGDKIQLTAQQFPKAHLDIFKTHGVRFNACSLRQLESFGQLYPGYEVSIRINPGVGSGSNRKTNVGGPSSSFGIWHEQLDQVKEIASKHNLKISRFHTHIGSGTDPEVWKQVAGMSLDFAVQFADVKTVNLGGGFKVARMSDEKTTNLQEIGEVVKGEFLRVFAETGRKLELEIEPGTYISAASGALVCEVDDVTDTGKAGYNFLKLNTGMDAITRPALYASRHPMEVLPVTQTTETVDYVVTGHCCESGDVFTLTEDDTLQPRTLLKAELGDLVVIEGAGAYCSSMNLANYNSFPALTELLADKDGKLHILKKAEKVEDLLAREEVVDFL
ncbi:MAG: diaminopimelate decarboxylase [Lentisphaeraceae bacterium]|nr:diaminopimelate decarboxylase [Lentisphaeraceae bacterium]